MPVSASEVIAARTTKLPLFQLRNFTRNRGVKRSPNSGKHERHLFFPFFGGRWVGFLSCEPKQPRGKLAKPSQPSKQYDKAESNQLTSNYNISSKTPEAKSRITLYAGINH